MPLWTYADIGFDTGKQLWIVQFHDAKGDGAGMLAARSIAVRDGTSFQYEWADNGQLPNGQVNPRDFWHVRQRILPEHVLRVTMEDGAIAIEGIRGVEPEGEAPFPLEEGVAAIEFAYSLGTSKGFVELVDAKGKVTKKLEGRWIITENLTMNTVGTYPHIRLRAEAEDVHGLVITGTSCTIVGRRKE